MSPSFSPSDVATVISILPFAIREKKPGLIPSEFYIPSAIDEFQTLVVKRCTFAVYLDEHRPPLVVPDPSDQVAQSIVYDFKVATIGFIPDEVEPGLFWVPGAFTSREEIARLFKVELEDARRKQMNWFKKLVAVADDDWGKYQQHKFISSIQRFAAKTLKLERAWNLDVLTEQASIRCPYCATQVAVGQIVCGSCRGILDKTKFKPEDFAKA